MTRFNASFKPYAFMATAAWWLVSGALVLAANDSWDAAASGVWETDTNWADNTSPGVFDTATFNLAGAYTVAFNAVPTPIRELTLTGAANVTLTSANSVDVRTLRVNSSLSGGSQNVNISSGASLSLGTFVFGINISKPLHLTVGNRLSVASGSTLNVRFGSDVTTPELTGDGQVNVSGSGSTLNVTTNAIDFGSLNATAGGVVQTTTASFGDGGIASVSGSGSQWIATGSVVIGSEDQGTLNITAGGKVQSLTGVIGSEGIGFVTVSGAGSQWNNLDSLIVGQIFGSGTLNVTGGGSVSCIDGFIGRFFDSDGTATVTGGAWSMTGRLAVGGDADDGAPGGPGTLNIQPAGTVTAAQGVVLFPDAHVNLQGGTLDASAISFQGVGGQFQWTSGTLHVGTFNGNLTNSGGTLAPGHSAGSTTINGNYTRPCRTTTTY